MRLVFLGSQKTISDSPLRGYGAAEHDREWRRVSLAFAKAGHETIEADWRENDLPDGDLYWVRSTWNYEDHLEDFVEFLDRPSLKGKIANHPDLIRMNLSKTYLKEFESKGIPIIPSLFPDGEATAAQLWQQLNSDDIIVKPVLDGSAIGQARLIKEETFGDLPLPKGIFCQPFITDIMTRGEISLVYLNGEFTHACRKTNPTGDYRIQSLYGGMEEPHDPCEEELEIGKAIIDLLPKVPLGACVDILPTRNGPLLMELEAIEPFLYPDFCKRYGERVLEAVQDYLGA